MKRINTIAWTFGVLLLAMTVGCSGGSGGASSASGEVLDIRVNFANAPALYDPVEVTVTIKANEALEGPVKAWLKLPPTAAFINGQTQWEGTIANGDTAEFKATVAFVAEGFSHVVAWATVPDTGKVNDIYVNGGAARLRVDKEGGELNAVYINDAPSYAPPEFTPTGGDVLVNAQDSPRAFVIRGNEAMSQIQQLALVPANPSGSWTGKTYLTTGILDRPVEEDVLLFALYDQQRPTTGYHLAVLHIWSGYAANQLLGEFPREHPAVILDVIATSPRPDWPVENRPVSPYTLNFIPEAFVGVIDVFLWINGEEVGRYTFDRANPDFVDFDELPVPKVEVIPLPAIGSSSQGQTTPLGTYNPFSNSAPPVVPAVIVTP